MLHLRSVYWTVFRLQKTKEDTSLKYVRKQVSPPVCESHDSRNSSWYCYAAEPGGGRLDITSFKCFGCTETTRAPHSESPPNLPVHPPKPPVLALEREEKFKIGKTNICPALGDTATICLCQVSFAVYISRLNLCRETKHEKEHLRI